MHRRQAILQGLAIALAGCTRSSETAFISLDESEAIQGPDRAARAARCPVSGSFAVPSAWTDFVGGRLHFCCADILPHFEPEQPAHRTAANIQLAITGQAIQQKCPVSGREVTGEWIRIVAGVPIRFANKLARDRFLENGPLHQREVLFGARFGDVFRVQPPAGRVPDVGLFAARDDSPPDAACAAILNGRSLSDS